MTRTYEGMFLLDNDTVRAGWDPAKSVVTGLIEKHKGKVLAARRWDERRLAYPIRGRKRGTYLLAYYEIDPDSATGLVRDLDISEQVLRYLLTRTEEVPAKEIELSQGESAADFVVPEPPPDDAPDSEVVEPTKPAGAGEGEKDVKSAREESPVSGDADEEKSPAELETPVAAGASDEASEEQGA